MTTDLRDEGERWSLDELRARQLERLQDTVRRCYANVPHYKKTWDEAGVHPDDIRALSDLAKLPFTIKLSRKAVMQDEARAAAAANPQAAQPTA